jgi:hypothetical protein
MMYTEPLELVVLALSAMIEGIANSAKTIPMKIEKLFVGRRHVSSPFGFQFLVGDQCLGCLLRLEGIWDRGAKKMNRLTVAISAVLVVVASAGAMSETCNIPTDNEVQARTAKCLVSIDGRVLVNERCNISVAANGGIAFEFGKYYVDVRTVNASRRSEVATASWNGGSGRDYPLTSLGGVTAFQRNGAKCVRNIRLEMCYSDLLTCKCGPGEAYGCKPGDSE